MILKKTPIKFCMIIFSMLWAKTLSTETSIESDSKKTIRYNKSKIEPSRKRKIKWFNGERNNTKLYETWSVEGVLLKIVQKC